MPVPVILLIAGAIGLIAGVAGAVVVLCWDRVVGWTGATFLPWVDTHFPALSDIARQAFMSVHNVVREVRLAVRQAWTALRTRLVRQMVEFCHDHGNKWLVRTVSWVIAALGPDGTPEVVSHETTRTLGFDEIPQELMDSWLQRRDDTITFDLLDLRDKEIAQLDLS